MNLSEFISSSNNTILLDGAMGTQLAEVGLEMGGQTDEGRDASLPVEMGNAG